MFPIIGPEPLRWLDHLQFQQTVSKRHFWRVDIFRFTTGSEPVQTQRRYGWRNSADLRTDRISRVITWYLVSSRVCVVYIQFWRKRFKIYCSFTFSYNYKFTICKELFPIQIKTMSNTKVALYLTSFFCSTYLGESHIELWTQ